jgi:SOS-response transcriptional repressor LexA
MNDDFEINDPDSGVSIHAGFPNPATDKRLRSLDLNQLLITHPSSTFIFRIRGDQGANYGIFDGDIAIVDRAATPTKNDFVLWHDGRQFKLSRSAKMTDSSTLWGIASAIIHQYRNVTQ